MGLQRSPATPKPETPKRFSSPISQKPTQKATNFSRSLSGYFSRSAQVQPRPPTPEVTELVRLVDDLKAKESRLRIEILEHKLLKQSASIVPLLEKEIALKNAEIEVSLKKINILESENEKLRGEIERLSKKSDGEEEREEKLKEMEREIIDLRRAIEEKDRGESKGSCEGTREIDECSTSHRFQRSIDKLVRSNSWKNSKKEMKWSEDLKTQANKNLDHASDLKRDDTQNSESDAQSAKHRVPRVPKPPPKPSSSTSSSLSSSSASSVVSSALPEIPPPPPALSSRVPAPPPPPPPPLPAKVSNNAPAKVRRVPEVVEFYHSLMRRDSKRDSGAGMSDVPSAANTRNMIGEIENRSAHLLAIKTDVETQGDFIRFLIKEVQNASFTEIEDVVAFVKWLDDELSFLVDERAVLKNFDWPEHKADAMREAAFGYYDLKKLESEASSFRDELRQPCRPALKKMQFLFEKLERGVFNISRIREAAVKRYKGFQIPWEWMLETGFVNKIKLSSVRLAMKYMKRVCAELKAGVSTEEENLMLQAVRFAFRVHQFAGGFDVETMRAFEELRSKAS